MSGSAAHHLRVYDLALRFAQQVRGVLEETPRGYAYLADQLHRAAASVVLNIAEGAGEYARREKARFFRMARRSASECSAILDLCEAYRVISAQARKEAAQYLDEIGAMLTGLIRRHVVDETDADARQK